LWSEETNGKRPIIGRATKRGECGTEEEGMSEQWPCCLLRRLSRVVSGPHELIICVSFCRRPLQAITFKTPQECRKEMQRVSIENNSQWDLKGYDMNAFELAWLGNALADREVRKALAPCCITHVTQPTNELTRLHLLFLSHSSGQRTVAQS
jgi:hypothetical protein